MGPEGGLHVRAGKKQGPLLTHGTDVNSAHNVKGLGREFFPTLASR